MAGRAEMVWDEGTPDGGDEGEEDCCGDDDDCGEDDDQRRPEERGEKHGDDPDLPAPCLRQRDPSTAARACRGGSSRGSPRMQG